MHNLGNRVLSFATRLICKIPTTDVMTGHKCFSREVVNSMDLREPGFNVEVEITAKISGKGWRFQEIPIKYSRRRYGRAKIGYIDGINRMIKLVKYALFD